MNTIIQSTSVHDKGCNGCVQHKRDVMITLITDPPEGSDKKMGFNDFFLTNEQAARLMMQLQEVLMLNTSPE